MEGFLPKQGAELPKTSSLLPRTDQSQKCIKETRRSCWSAQFLTDKSRIYGVRLALRAIHLGIELTAGVLIQLPALIPHSDCRLIAPLLYTSDRRFITRRFE